MNKLEQIENDLKTAFQNYESNNLQETLNYLDRILSLILNDDETLKKDPYLKNLSCYVFKAIVLNGFYNRKEMNINDLDSLLADEEKLKQNVKEFCINFKDNKFIDFINYIENVEDNQLLDIRKIIMLNIGKMNISNTSISKEQPKSIEQLFIVVSRKINGEITIKYTNDFINAICLQKSLLIGAPKELVEATLTEEEINTVEKNLTTLRRDRLANDEEEVSIFYLPKVE